MVAKAALAPSAIILSYMDYKIFSLGSNDVLAKKIADKLGTTLGEVQYGTFSDGEQRIQFLENVRGKSIYLVQSTNPPAENWIRLFLALDAAHGASASEITVVMPYFGYSRQDRKTKSREPISARVFASSIENLGATRLLTMDLHNDAIGGFFRDTIVDNLYARWVFIPHFKTEFKEALEKDELIIVSPDAGGVVRAQSYAKRLMRSGDLAIIHKERDIPNHVARMKLVGDVKDKVVLITDDMVDTCGTLSRAVELLVENGAREIYATATHGVLSGNAVETLDKSAIKKLFITDSISTGRPLPSKAEVISVDELFAEAIRRLENDESLSELFETD
jgi:ribose-phosphate pyrophosphokinase